MWAWAMAEYESLDLKSWLNGDSGIKRVRDDRKGDRHKAKRPKRKELSRWEARNVIAWDGEGANLNGSGEHIYNLLANSVGTYIRDDVGLSTKQCLEFFLAHNPNSAIHVIFGGSYDVNMILRDLPRSKIQELWEYGSVIWQRYKITYQPRKRFSVCRWSYDERTAKRKFTRPFVLWDVFGFYQCSFVKAIDKWLGNSVASSVLEMIQQMKYARATFTVGDFDAIAKYNKMECQLLVLLVRRLFDAMDEAEISLQRFDGAGAIASALLRKYDVSKHSIQPPDTVYRYAQVAYSGGRIEAPRIGNYEGAVYRRDKNSAYPWGIAKVPSLAGAEWSIDGKWNECDQSMVAIQWAYTRDEPFYPLFYRTFQGQILYPKQGEGIYFGPEFRALREHYQEGTDFMVMFACNVWIKDQTLPMDFINEIYSIRLAFKEQGKMAEVALKLGMNSVPGKCAQQSGYRGDRIPTHHNLLWAGLTTSYTRADLFRIAMLRPESIIAFATDAIISTSPIEGENIPGGTALGGWSNDIFSGVTIVQPGVYWLKPEGEEWDAKYRGFDAGSLPREDIILSWELGDRYYCAPLTRFVGMGSALSRRKDDFKSHWRHWETEGRKMDLYPSGKRIPSDETDYHRRLCRTLPAPNMTIDVPSAAYPVEWVNGSEASTPWMIDGIPARILENEAEDSYE